MSLIIWNSRTDKLRKNHAIFMNNGVTGLYWTYSETYKTYTAKVLSTFFWMGSEFWLKNVPRTIGVHLNCTRTLFCACRWSRHVPLVIPTPFFLWFRWSWRRGGWYPVSSPSIRSAALRIAETGTRNGQEPRDDRKTNGARTRRPRTTISGENARRRDEKTTPLALPCADKNLFDGAAEW